LKVSLDRISKFLTAEEINTEYIKKNEIDYPETAIRVKNGNFYWLTEEEKRLKKKREEEENEEGDDKKEIVGREEPPASENEGEKLILKDINLEIKKGSFVAILGDVGSGKSSFLFSLTGEMKFPANILPEPEIIINGEVSHVPQQAWILNTTVKDNILFGNEYHDNKYQDAIKYSCLQSDLDILINGDQTEIGEKGVNLSGGQKARVSLARALYKDSDIYLLDDPLSAVDAHVGNFILKECFVGHLKDKTRVLVTHKFENLKYVDYIYILNKGQIVQEGTFETLQSTEIFQEIKEKYNMINRQGEETSKELTQEEKKSSDTEETQLIKEPSKEAEEKKEIPSEDKELLHKLMLEEDKEEGAVGAHVWKTYFSYYGGWFFYFTLLIVMIIAIVSQTGANFWLSYWSDNADDKKHSRNYYFLIYTALGFGYGVFAFIKALMLRIQATRFSRFIHKEMFSKVIRAPINLFFDRVPSGRILNRFSKDLNVIDEELAGWFCYVLDQLFDFLADIVVCVVIGTFWVFPLVMLFCYLCHRLNKNFTNINREVTRLGKKMIDFGGSNVLLFREHFEESNCEFLFRIFRRLDINQNVQGATCFHECTFFCVNKGLFSKL